jgi:hypothetical protein
VDAVKRFRWLWEGELHGVWLALAQALCTVLLYAFLVLAVGMLLVSMVRADTLHRDGFEEGEPGGPVDPCAHPLVQPAGWQVTTKSWQQAWSSPDGSPQATFPQSVGFPVPIGAQKGGYTVIPFLPTGGQTVQVTWDTAQSNAPQGYRAPRPAHTMLLNISECPGDVRPPSIGGNFDACVRLSGLDSMFWTTEDTSTFACQLQVGRVYYLNVMAADPTDGLELSEHTCNDLSPWTTFGCDVQAIHRPQ